MQAITKVYYKFYLHFWFVCLNNSVLTSDLNRTIMYKIIDENIVLFRIDELRLIIIL